MRLVGIDSQGYAALPHLFVPNAVYLFVATSPDADVRLEEFARTVVALAGRQAPLVVALHPGSGDLSPQLRRVRRLYGDDHANKVRQCAAGDATALCAELLQAAADNGTATTLSAAQHMLQQCLVHIAEHLHEQRAPPVATIAQARAAAAYAGVEEAQTHASLQLLHDVGRLRLCGNDRVLLSPCWISGLLEQLRERQTKGRFYRPWLYDSDLEHDLRALLVATGAAYPMKRGGKSLCCSTVPALLPEGEPEASNVAYNKERTLGAHTVPSIIAACQTCSTSSHSHPPPPQWSACLVLRVSVAPLRLVIARLQAQVGAHEDVHVEHAWRRGVHLACRQTQGTAVVRLTADQSVQVIERATLCMWL